METESSHPSSSDDSSLTALLKEFFASPLNIALTLVCAYLVYKLLKKSSNADDDDIEVLKIPPPLPKHELTLDELRKYDGTNEDGRVCIAINGNVYDCSKGRRFYGPGGPYAPFAGRDATRALASFDVTAVKDEWDDNLDLTAAEKSSVQEWEMQFSERYEFVGKLVKELPSNSGGDSKESPKEEEEKEKEKEKEEAKTVEEDDEESKEAKASQPFFA